MAFIFTITGVIFGYCLGVRDHLELSNVASLFCSPLEFLTVQEIKDFIAMICLLILNLFIGEMLSNPGSEEIHIKDCVASKLAPAA